MPGIRSPLLLCALAAAAPCAPAATPPLACDATTAAAALTTLDLGTPLRLQQAQWIASPPDGQPPHCEITAVIGEHRGAPADTAYGNHIRLRVPAGWDGRLVFQGGGGNNGVLGDALGRLNDGSTALGRGHAVLAQDSGHLGRAPHFALDAQAYRAFAHEGVHQATQAGKALLAAVAGARPHHAYFVGCSNGGREALVTAQRHADFDGVVAGAPGLAVYDQWLQNLNVLQIVARVAGTPAGQVPTDTSRAYSDAQLQQVAAHFLARCDALDGLADGLVSHPQACRASEADYRALTCRADGGASDDPSTCLTRLQAEGLRQIHTGATTRDGRLLWPGFVPGSMERAMRKPYLGGAPGGPLLGAFYDSIMPNLYFMGYGFRGWPGVSGPADALGAYPSSSVAYVAGFDLDTEPPRLAQGRLDFHGANTDPSQPGPSFDAFAQRGGRMLVYTGAADHGVQAPGIMAWMDRLRAQYGAAGADRMAALFIVPGMDHCRGGDGLERFDPLAPLIRWVEQGERPAQILARPAASGALARQWPDAVRPLCPYPAHAHYRGTGSPAAADSFVCQAP
ncbi:tannase/feruloyl esterase family alpha/beta hydrolase [Ideonella sp. DXS22W]|uniref:Tannase/feruloyl esterase family alpha/beta hydrolase n=1 Tax=Pseudaquabacterium inlustre TaxID=2984192 RepID=A0ABU9CLM7_9BURK